MSERTAAKTSLRELAVLYLRLGITSFGGPAAHIAVMEDEIVVRKGWLSRETFVDLVGATNLIPGPNSTEMALHVGYMRAGFAGLLVAGGSFILPAVIITGVVAWLYQRFGALPAVQPFLWGLQPAVVAIIAAAAIRLGRTAVKKSVDLAAIALIVFLASLLGVDEVLALFAGGILGGLWLIARKRWKANLAIAWPFLTGLPMSAVVTSPTPFVAASLLSLFLVFLKVGAVLYGSGYVLIALLHDQLVQGLRWLTESQLLDAIAVGQFTPGPVLSTATFIGFQIHGISGAIVATAGVFLPSFLFVAIVNPFIPRLRSSAFFAHFLDAVNASSVALIAAVAVELARSAYTGVASCLIFVAAVAALTRKIPSAWVVVGSGAAGLLIALAR